MSSYQRSSSASKPPPKSFLVPLPFATRVEGGEKGGTPWRNAQTRLNCIIQPISQQMQKAGKRVLPLKLPIQHCFEINTLCHILPPAIRSKWLQGLVVRPGASRRIGSTGGVEGRVREEGRRARERRPRRHLALLEHDGQEPVVIGTCTRRKNGNIDNAALPMLLQCSLELRTVTLVL